MTAPSETGSASLRELFLLFLIFGVLTTEDIKKETPGHFQICGHSSEVVRRHQTVFMRVSLIGAINWKF